MHVEFQSRNRETSIFNGDIWADDAAKTVKFQSRNRETSIFNTGWDTTY